MKEKELLQDLTQMTGCSFISDLKFLPEPDLIKIVLKNVSSDAYSVFDWNQTVYYLTGNKELFDDAEQAKQYLLAVKLPRQLP